MTRRRTIGGSALALAALASASFASSVAACGNRAAPTWDDDVAPLLAARCVGCHRADGAAFSLESYEAARSFGPAIAHDVEARIMPPWPPTDGEGCPPFQGDRHLARGDIDLLRRWVSDGMPRGGAGSPISVPPSFGVLEGISVELGPDAPYQPKIDSDDYHCFLVDPGLTEDAFITAYRVAAGRAVHHLEIWEVEDDGDVPKLASLDALTPEPGFECTQWPGYLVRNLSVWGPSDPVRRHPAGTGVRLRAGKKIVLQVHYHQATVPDQTHVGLALASHVDHEASLMMMAPGYFTLPPREPGITVHASMKITDPLTLWGVRGHMHRLGSAIHIRREHPNGPECLLSIPSWSADWQLMYFYDHPIDLAPGDTIDTDCTYNTMSKSTPVRDGITADDEMCNGYLYVTGRAP